MKVKIIRTVPLLINGTVSRPTAGTVVDGLSDDVAQALVRGGDAEIVQDAPSAPTVEVTTHTHEPRGFNKNRGNAPRNK